MPTEADIQFGELAIKHKLISRAQHDEALELLKKLEAQLKSQGLLKKKRPRLVDVLVQKKMINGSQAKSVENARLYRQMRLDDKLYGRVAIKSKLAKPAQVEKALEAQKKAYLDKDEPPRVADYLMKKGWLTEDQHQAIRSAIQKLDAETYVGKDARKRKKGKPARTASGSGSGLGSQPELEEASDEFDDEELEEVASGSGSGSEPEVEELDLDDIAEEDSGSDERPARKGGKTESKGGKGKAPEPKGKKEPEPKGKAKGKGKEAAAPTTSGLDLKIDLDDDDAREVPEIGSSEEADAIDSQIDLKLSGIDDDLETMDEATVAAKAKEAKGKGKAPAKPAAKAPSEDEGDDLDDVDLDDVDLDDDDLDDDDDDDVGDDLDDVDLDDLDDDDAPAKKPPAKGKEKPAPKKSGAGKKPAADDDDDDLDIDDIDLDDD